MSINFFFTPQFAQNAQTQAGGVLPELSGEHATGGEKFAQIILEYLNQQQNANDETLTDASEHDPLSSDNPALDKNPELKLAEILAENPEIKDEVKDFIESTGLGESSALFQTITLNKIAFDEVLVPVETADIVETQDGTIKTSDDIAKELDLQEIVNLILNPDTSSPGMQGDSTPLKGPVEIIVELIEPEGFKALEELTPEELAKINATGIKVEENAEYPVDVMALLPIIQDITPNSSSEEIEQIAAQLNALITGSAPAEIQAPVIQNLTAQQTAPLAQAVPLPPSIPVQNIQRTASQPLAPQADTDTQSAPLSFASDAEAGEFDAALEQAVKSGKTGNNVDTDALTQGTAKNAQNTNAQANAAFVLPALASAFDGSLLAQNNTLEQYGSTPLPATQSLQMAGLTSTITQAQSAAQAHPATQAVAISIQKSMGQGGEKTFTLQLDPPELGRVQVEMTFGKDKVLKAIVTSEKPETHAMLQRDAQTLERILQGDGIDADGGIEFELAEHGFDFDQDNKRGGGHDNGGTGAGEASDEPEIIESTMTWHVDPDTGHIRYNILV